MLFKDLSILFKVACNPEKVSLDDYMGCLLDITHSEKVCSAHRRVNLVNKWGGSHVCTRHESLVSQIISLLIRPKRSFHV